MLRTGGKQVIKWTAEGAVNNDYPLSILQRQARVRCQGYDGILISVQHNAVNQGGTADRFYSSLTETISVRGVFLCAGAHRGICCLRSVRPARRVGEKHPYSIVQGRTAEFAACAACAPRGELREKLPYLIVHNWQKAKKRKKRGEEND